VLRPAFHVGLFAWLHLDCWALLFGDRLLTKHTNALLSLFPHRRTPGRSLGHHGILDTLQQFVAAVSDGVGTVKEPGPQRPWFPPFERYEGWATRHSSCTRIGGLRPWEESRDGLDVSPLGNFTCAAPGLVLTLVSYPMPYGMGCILSPLCGLGSMAASALRTLGLRNDGTPLSLRSGGGAEECLRPCICEKFPAAARVARTRHRGAFASLYSDAA